MSAPYDSNKYRAVVDRHKDGDTSIVAIDRGFNVPDRVESLTLTIRWYGLNADPLGTPLGDQAAAWVNQRMPAGSAVLLQGAVDPAEKFGRYLATFFDPATGSNINQELIAAGLAKPYFGGKKGPGE